MRGVDTNVLLRYLTEDDPEQARAARELFERAEAEGETFYVPAVVVCEMVWALRGPSFRRKRPDIVLAVETLLGTALFELQERDLIRRALADFREGPGDFADYLIGWRSGAAGCRHTVTFDRALLECQRFSVIDPPETARPAR